MGGDRLRDAELRMIAFMAAAAWRPGQGAEPRDRVQYLRRLSDINRESHRLIYADEEVVAPLSSVPEACPIRLGRAIGFIAVLPLTDLGYYLYTTNQSA